MRVSAVETVAYPASQTPLEKQHRPFLSPALSSRCGPPSSPTCLQPSDSTVVAVPFLTHFADLSSWEYAQALRQKVIPELQQQGVKVRGSLIAATVAKASRPSSVCRDSAFRSRPCASG